MKKSFLVLPVVMAILTACSSDIPAPVESVDGTLTPGIMQPVDNSSATGGTWEPQIQQQSMPLEMSTPVVTQPTYQAPKPQSLPQASTPTTPVSAPKPVTQHFEIPRNPQTNAPDYSKIDKGFYKGDSYTVRKGDTMFLIAYISGMDVKELAALNNMSEPYNLSVGQTLKVSNNRAPAMPINTQAVAAAPVVTKPVQPAVTYTPGPNGTQYGSDGTITGPIKSSVGSASAVAQQTVVGTTTITTTTVTQPAQTTPMPTTAATQAPVASNVAWSWPTNGKITQGFSRSDGGNKGIDIAGSRGQAVNAAAAGRVVYAGNALRGYGNLIIIKHNDDYLSAYAHNESILVKDQQEVKAGQQIAKMGSSGTTDVKLHFEIRYKGKSVDPLRYLPKR
ncbi:MAG: murein hydrolase activator NlpD [[Pasteurella] mairii]|uniref:Outer membrane antigenic lipoprotein B n=1 Tax=[Pasteurella] mairii TaxID=757 RepID=A0A379B6U0_9PAST|nr:murein hydrolase activator NlpD [[Pasteurella] mairii]SUB34221.1 outer membrane antigenic lipoprotein B [[Pasteurella] mairii]